MWNTTNAISGTEPPFQGSALAAPRTQGAASGCDDLRLSCSSPLPWACLIRPFGAGTAHCLIEGNSARTTYA